MNTPRTDAHSDKMVDEDFDVELALTYDIARQLETELAALPRRESPALAEAIARAEKAEAELCRVRHLYDEMVMVGEDKASPEASQLGVLRPIAEAGPVPEGAVRVYARFYAGLGEWRFYEGPVSQADSFIDIYPPQQ